MTSVTRLQIATAHAENINKSTSAPDPITRRSRFVPSGIVIPSKHKFQLFFKLVPIPHSREDTSRFNFHHVRGRVNFRPIVENKIARSFLFFFFFARGRKASEMSVKMRKWFGPFGVKKCKLSFLIYLHYYYFIRRRSPGLGFAFRRVPSGGWKMGDFFFFWEKFSATKRLVRGRAAATEKDSRSNLTDLMSRRPLRGAKVFFSWRRPLTWWGGSKFFRQVSASCGNGQGLRRAPKKSWSFRHLSGARGLVVLKGVKRWNSRVSNLYHDFINVILKIRKLIDAKVVI